MNYLSLNLLVLVLVVVLVRINVLVANGLLCMRRDGSMAEA
jgi:hypothetical protein